MWNLKVIDTSKPLYIAVADALERDIGLGVLRPGDKMPTHRELAKIVGVTVTTITRAYKEAERRGLITATVGSGTFVTADRGFNSSLIDTASRDNRLIEMGLVFPLYNVEIDLRQVLARLTGRSDLQDFMRYIPPQGLLRHRQVGAEWMTKFGVAATADNVIVTAGAQHAMTCVFTSVFQPGDHIAVDQLTYPGVKSAARRCGIKLEGVPMDGQGMLPRELEAVCARHDIKGVYTVGCMQNPTNAAMSEERRRAIAEVIKQQNILLFEDDLYSFLADEPACTISAFAPEHSLYLAGLAKAFYSGLRVGFLLSPPRFFNRIAQAVLDTMWMASPLCAEIACESIRSGIAGKIIRKRRKEIDRRALLLEETLRGFNYTYAPHSMFAWLELPDYWHTNAFEAACRQAGINVVAADKFAVGGIVPPNYVRLSLTGAADNNEFKKGLEILLEVLQRETGEASGIL